MPSTNYPQKQFIITHFGAVTSPQIVNTAAIQRAIDTAAGKGGVVVIPKGVFLTGAIFFVPGVNLHIEEGGTLLGSDSIGDYPKIPSRIEGVTQDYFSALVNAHNCPGFTLSGSGTIDGNGLKFWQAYWARREQNLNCTNLEVARPRLIFIWNSNDICINGVTLCNSGFWTLHLYLCQRIKILNTRIFAPRKPVPAPSSDAIDLDVCSDVLIKGCDISVNDDAICIKGGKGANADCDPGNGSVKNVLIEECNFGWVHAVLTLGSEAIHCDSITLLNCKVDGAWILLRYKLRPDTPQLFENIRLENITGNLDTVLHIKPWQQFLDLGIDEIPLKSVVRNLILRNMQLTCRIFFDIQNTNDIKLTDFTLDNLAITAEISAFDANVISELRLNKTTFYPAIYHGTQGVIDEL